MLILKSLNEYVSCMKIKIKFVYVNNFLKCCCEEFCWYICNIFVKRVFYVIVLLNLVDDMWKKLINIYCLLCVWFWDIK